MWSMTMVLLTTTQARVLVTVVTVVTDGTAAEGTGNCDFSRVDGSGGPVWQNCAVAKLDDCEREYKILRFEDYCLWIVKNLKNQEREMFS